MKTTIIKSIVTITFLLLGISANAQIKYYSNGKVTMGNTEPYSFYHYTLYGTGMYFKFGTSNFFQIDVTPAATRLASHYDQVVFYNTATSAFNSIQVKNVYNYSDARAKTNIQSMATNRGINILKKLRPVTYSFKDNYLAKFSPTSTKEMGLLAQEVETVLPEIVMTDEEGKKLINYTALIPVLINAIQSLQSQVDALKAAK